MNIGAPAIDRSGISWRMAGGSMTPPSTNCLSCSATASEAEQVRMSEVLALGDLAEFANAAHRLRGAALSMGARMLAETAGDLYAAARADDTAACGGGMAILVTRVQLMVAEVPSIVAPRGP